MVCAVTIFGSKLSDNNLCRKFGMHRNRSLWLGLVQFSLIWTTAGFYSFTSLAIVLLQMAEQLECNIIQLFVMCRRLIDSYFMCRDIYSASLSLRLLSLPFCIQAELKAVANKECCTVKFCASFTATNYQKPKIYKHTPENASRHIHPKFLFHSVCLCSKRNKEKTKINRLNFFRHSNILTIEVYPTG